MAGDLRPYQIEGAAFLASKTYALLADEQGLGKTVQAIRAAVESPKFPVLVVAPAVVRSKWVEEWRRWANMDATILDSDTANDPLEAVVIVSHAVLSLQDSLAFRRIMAMSWGTVIVDEAHYQKDRTSKRTQALYGRKLDGEKALLSRTERVWLLTGTPARNHAGEIYTHLRALRPDLVFLPSKKRCATQLEFENAFCLKRQTPFGGQITGSKNTQKLREILNSGFMLRRKKADVAKDLPSLVITSTQIECAVGPQAADLEKALDGVDKSDPGAVVSALERLRGDAMFATIRRLVGLAKVTPAAEYARTILDGGTGKVILIAYHQQVCEKLQAALSGADHNAVLVYGSTTAKQRDEAIFRFQQDPRCRVFVGQIEACGTGIDLTAADRVLLVEPSWSPVDNAQAIARAHRIGQTRNVLAELLHSQTSIDRAITRSLARKIAGLDEIFK